MQSIKHSIEVPVQHPSTPTLERTQKLVIIGQVGCGRVIAWEPAFPGTIDQLRDLVYDPYCT